MSGCIRMYYLKIFMCLDFESLIKKGILLTSNNGMQTKANRFFFLTIKTKGLCAVCLIYSYSYQRLSAERSIRKYLRVKNEK